MIKKLNLTFRLFDFILSPFMWILSGFAFEKPQETHAWHIVNWNWKKQKPLSIKETDKEARFGHSSPLGLFHMPIFGGLTKYVVIEAVGYKRYWNVGWEGQVHLLKIYDPKIKLLVGKSGFMAYGITDTNKEAKLKIVGFGTIGDGKFKGVRLF